jgi:hypothetical protein
MKNIIFLVCFFMGLSLVQAKQAAKKQNSQSMIQMPSFEEFRKLSQNQKRDFVVAAQAFYVALSNDPSLKATAGINQNKYKVFLDLLMSEGYAAPEDEIVPDNRSPQQRAYESERAQEQGQVDAVARQRARAAMSPALREATENLERLQSQGTQSVQRVMDAKARERRIQDQLRRADSNDQDPINQERIQRLKDELDDAKNEIRSAERAARDSNPAAIGIARSRVERIQREEEVAAREGRLDDYRRRYGDPDAADARGARPQPPQPPDSGPKYACIFAGFAIPEDRSCTVAAAPFEWTGKINGAQVKFSCREPSNPSATPPLVGNTNTDMRVLCNPILFGTDSNKPICVGRSTSATRACADRSAQLNNLDDITKVIEENKQDYENLMTMYSRLCRGDTPEKIARYLESNMAQLLRRRTPPPIFNDIAMTCMNFRDQYTKVYQKAQSNGRGGAVNVNPATGRN